MFDLKYYNMLSKLDKYFDEDKGNIMSRQSLHNMFSYKNGKKPDILLQRINNLPNNDPIKNELRKLYENYGEKAINDVLKQL